MRDARRLQIRQVLEENRIKIHFIIEGLILELNVNGFRLRIFPLKKQAQRQVGIDLLLGGGGC